jgi:hypothetical protein
MKSKGKPLDLCHPCTYSPHPNPQKMKGFEMSEQKMRDMFESGELTWADLLEITGLPAHVLYSILDDLI